MILRGIGASEGIGVGQAVCIKEEIFDYSHVVYSGAEKEKLRLGKAVEQFLEKTAGLLGRKGKIASQEETDILNGQSAMLQDPFLRSQMDEKMETGQCAEAAVDEICTMYVEMFEGAEEELIRQRATDVKDMRSRLLSLLLGRESVDLTGIPKGSILVVHDLTPSMTVGLNREQVHGIVTESGGRTSHAAILARALELPAVLGVEHACENIQDGDHMIIDGGKGDVLLKPASDTCLHYQKRQVRYQQERSRLEVYRNRSTVDGDGRPIHLFGNIAMPHEVDAVLKEQGAGIGLFRSEFLFLSRNSIPDEQEQFLAYQQVSNKMGDRPVMIRTLDLGGDKQADCLHIGKEENPFLGFRAIRVCLKRPDMFCMQLRAILKAGAQQKNLQIVLPMVTSVQEVRETKRLLEQCKEGLLQEGVPIQEDIPLGVMIETPAAVWIADRLAKECDFFSIGTNDLIQYTVAADRGNTNVEQLYSCFHPAVLREIQRTIQVAKSANILVGMCGEAAADPRLTPLLLAWGLDGFSVNASSILPMRRQLSLWKKEQAQTVANDVMQLETAEEIEQYLQQVQIQ